MSQRHSQILSLLLIALVISASTSLVANQQNRQRENVRGTGKIKTVGAGVLRMDGEKGEQWVVAVDARPQNISYQGTATPAFLRPGMLVQFQALLDKKGESHSPISEIKVVSMREGVQPGVRSEGGFTGGELFASDEPEANKKKRKPADAKPHSVTGTLRALKDRSFSVAAAGTLVKADIADGCAVTVDISDWSLARAGDSIELSGWKYADQPNQIVATRVSIIADSPIVPVEDTKRRRVGKKEPEKAAGEGTTKVPDKSKNPAEGGALKKGEADKSDG